MKKKPDGRLSGLGALSLARAPKTEEPTTDSQPPEPTQAPAARPVGRPKTGKRSNPDYRGVTVYLRKKHQREIDLWLRQRDDPRDFSDLVQELLDDWWNKQNG